MLTQAVKMLTIKGRVAGAWQRLAVTVVSAGVIFMVASVPAVATTSPAEEEAERLLDEELASQSGTIIPLRNAHPVLGRFVLSQVQRRAHITSALLDIKETKLVNKKTEAISEFPAGEILLHVYAANGTLDTVVVYAEGFTASAEPTDIVSVGLIIPRSVSSTHPDGVGVGHIALHVTPSLAKSLKKVTGTIQLNGRGPYTVVFTRISDTAAAPDPLPRAKQIGK